MFTRMSFFRSFILQTKRLLEESKKLHYMCSPLKIMTTIQQDHIFEYIVSFHCLLFIKTKVILLVTLKFLLNWKIKFHTSMFLQQNSS